MGNSIKSETKKGLLWGFLDRFSLQLIQFVIGIILARLLSPSDYGMIGMLGIFIAISQTLIDSGFSNALIQRKDRTDVDYSTVFYFNIAIGILLYIVAFFSAPFIAEFFNQPLLTSLFRVITLTFIFNSLIVVQRAITTINIDFRRQAYINVTSSVSSGIFGVVLAFNGYGVWSLAFQSVAHSIISCSLYWKYTKWTPLLLFSIDSFNRLFSYGSKILASGLLHTFYMQLTPVLIGKFYPPSALGYYSRAEHLANLPLHNITMVLQRVTFPIMSKIQDDDQRLIMIYGKYLRASSMVIFYVIIQLVVIADPLINVLLGSKWQSSILPFQLLCLAFIFDHLFSVNLNLLQVKGRSDLFLFLEIIKKTISVALILAGLYLGGVIGLCISRIIYSQLALVINTYYTGKLFGYSYKDQVRDFFPYLLVAFVSNAPSFVLIYVVHEMWINLIVGVALSAILYITMLYLKGDEFLLLGLSYIKTKCK